MNKIIIEVRYPDGNRINVEVENEPGLIKYEDGKVFMLVEGKIVQESRLDIVS